METESTTKSDFDRIFAAASKSGLKRRLETPRMNASFVKGATIPSAVSWFVFRTVDPSMSITPYLLVTPQRDQAHVFYSPGRESGRALTVDQTVEMIESGEL